MAFARYRSARREEGKTYLLSKKSMRITEIFLNWGVWKSDCAVDSLLAFKLLFFLWVAIFWGVFV